ncbi:MAG: helix-turn-helix transcriptional regulator [Oscillospiraceae bacterium]|nr:helix-turn-helix transcriptional regulator [Oscillospiraceae bacterium]MBQ2998088.1 helix-turn-helix transcriptional regulator [Oscillospiraceae bacterium]MBQ3560492.1 helix-turn-helix transcriptional regulator [Oscillospiraceae bacterium]MBQ6801687.1 helix-turn-helix transcriptional regulator [Oscillospiraceae bacterium]
MTYELDKERFGEFVSKLRKEQGMTQKELAERLFVSDKAVSKWERGQSLPDITMLNPLAEALGVTSAELLNCGRLEESEKIDASQVDELVEKAISLSDEKERLRKLTNTKGIFIYLICVVIGVIGAVLCNFVYLKSINTVIWTFEGLFAVFGAYFMFFVKERLPEYYDSNKISLYGHGAFRMNLPGISLNNRNWPYIVTSARTGLLLGLAVTPFLFLLAFWLLPPHIVDKWIKLLFLIAAVGFIVVPIYAAARKHK